MTFGPSAVTSRQIQRWYDKLRHYDYTVKHIRGQDNVMAYFLSRISEGCDPSDEPTLPDDDDSVTIAILDSSDFPILPQELSDESKKDHTLTLVRKYLKSSWHQRKKLNSVELQAFHDCALELSMKDDVVFRVYSTGYTSFFTESSPAEITCWSSWNS